MHSKPKKSSKLRKTAMASNVVLNSRLRTLSGINSTPIVIKRKSNKKRNNTILRIQALKKSKEKRNAEIEAKKRINSLREFEALMASFNTGEGGGAAVGKKNKKNKKSKKSKKRKSY